MLNNNNLSIKRGKPFGEEYSLPGEGEKFSLLYEREEGGDFFFEIVTISRKGIRVRRLFPAYTTNTGTNIVLLPYSGGTHEKGIYPLIKGDFLSAEPEGKNIRLKVRGYPLTRVYLVSPKTGETIESSFEPFDK